MRILLIEDDESIREVFKLMLEAEAPFPNLIVETASNGSEAIQSVQKTKPDLILLDLTLPEGHGFDVFKELRAIENCRTVPTVAVTAHNLPELEQEATELGFSGYVTKPIDFDQKLFPLMREILSKQPSERASSPHAAA